MVVLLTLGFYFSPKPVFELKLHDLSMTMRDDLWVLIFRLVDKDQASSLVSNVTEKGNGQMLTQSDRFVSTITGQDRCNNWNNKYTLNWYKLKPEHGSDQQFQD
ncbi:hypothetical protein DY000_02024439 [Brassica cretica]|uniref:Uncharacterized protein n=1 Tax=Brassica cretica TaxID=69181 RepID=A0ABQ7E749_BRACR|nr:hypothetical protein DY000_02024439 [Brassica cretica]